MGNEQSEEVKTVTVKQYCPFQAICKYYKASKLPEYNEDAIEVTFDPHFENTNIFKCRALKERGKRHTIDDGETAPQREVDCSYLGLLVKTTQND